MRTELPVRPRTAVPVALAAATVLLQIAYPLVEGTARDRLSIAVVVVFAATCIAHAAATRGVRITVTVVLVTAGGGLLAEVVGVHTGVPFGRYTYSDGLGPRVLGVPLVIGLAWTMLAWPAMLAGRRLVSGYLPRVLVGGWALATTDLFLDPQQVAAGHWRWRDPTPHLPGVGDVPLTNYAGWLLVSIALSAVLQGILRGPADDRLGTGLYLWLYIGWVVALASFLDLPAAAGWGALGMGTVAVPLALRLRR